MKRNRGFTLMEMLIVVAIIAVLAAIAIPVFNGSLHKAKVAADMANVRAYYAELRFSRRTAARCRSKALCSINTARRSSTSWSCTAATKTLSAS